MSQRSKHLYEFGTFPKSRQHICLDLLDFGERGMLTVESNRRWSLESHGGFPPLPRGPGFVRLRVAFDKGISQNRKEDMRRSLLYILLMCLPLLTSWKARPRSFQRAT